MYDRTNSLGPETIDILLELSSTAIQNRILPPQRPLAGAYGYRLLHAPGMQDSAKATDALLT